ncbi:hypothetical protein VCRA2113O415_350014 [Vibrio crassostreae]|nr:hypothetical protein VCRA2113O415_350014 [Vibrio crassostreae]
MCNVINEEGYGEFLTYSVFFGCECSWGPVHAFYSLSNELLCSFLIN